ncbi:BLUF domain-containing protein [Allofranklinella schreckenbergeri]|uniref:BLUF domain-containing protein n=1 Tax=Allofranklinella schreckenbergeri TaxID=1076744 RepID=A0A3M6QCS1_9BURK|nr:BLUF domain-containing protein [Allofranklinella schreckenbergeri]RMX00421.1 BLUF domain-containing protein [Allofranklinella schreckenbergeri]
MLVQLIFASQARQSCAATIQAILAQGRARNAQRGITGVLCHGYGVYIQAMEGERSAVSDSYAQVLRDERHEGVQLLHFAEIDERRFANWALGQVKLEALTPSWLLKYAERLPLTPQQFNARSVQAMMLDLVATGSVAHQ